MRIGELARGSPYPGLFENITRALSQEKWKETKAKPEEGASAQRKEREEKILGGKVFTRLSMCKLFKTRLQAEYKMQYIPLS